MKNLYFDDFEDFSCAVVDTYDALDYDEEDVAIIAKYEEARQIVKELACIGYDLHSIDIDDEFDGYNAEYIITLYDNEIFCEPMLRENGYIEEYAPVIYVLEEVVVGFSPCLNCDTYISNSSLVAGLPLIVKHSSQSSHSSHPHSSSSSIPTVTS